MDKDRVEGAGRKMGGKMKEGLGRAVGDEKLKGEGKADQMAGKAQNVVGGIKDSLRDKRDRT